VSDSIAGEFAITDALDTFDGYYSNVFIRNCIVIIPYINLGIAEHPLNMDTNLSFIDYSYVVCKGVRLIATQTGPISEAEVGSYVWYFGGTPMDECYLPDIAIVCESVSLHTLPTSRIAKHQWHLRGPNRNVESDAAQEFFRGAMMPDCLKRLMG
jgi:hypothetical protein